MRGVIRIAMSHRPAKVQLAFFLRRRDLRFLRLFLFIMELELSLDELRGLFDREYSVFGQGAAHILDLLELLTSLVILVLLNCVVSFLTIPQLVDELLVEWCA